MLIHNSKQITAENITVQDVEEIFDFDRDVMLQHRLKLGKEYVEKHFPINKQEESRVKKILAKNIELSDPKTFKDPKPALTYGEVFGDDPKDKKVKDIITVKVKSTSTKGILVSAEGSDFEILIKKNQIAINAEDARSNRFVQGDRIDAAIAEINQDKRKIVLSIKLLEEMQNKEAVTKFSSPLSGKNLPFSSLSEKLDEKKKEDK